MGRSWFLLPLGISTRNEGRTGIVAFAASSRPGKHREPRLDFRRKLDCQHGETPQKESTGLRFPKPASASSILALGGAPPYGRLSLRPPARHLWFSYLKHSALQSFALGDAVEGCQALQELPKPIALGAPERGDPHLAVGSTQDRGDGHHDHVDQFVATLQFAARILKIGEVTNKRTVAGKRRYSRHSW